MKAQTHASKETLGGMLWQGLGYALVAVLAAGWPFLMLTKVLPSLVHASGSPRLEGLMDSFGAGLLGGVGSLALGDFVARRASGRRAFLFAAGLFGLVFVLSLGLSVVWPLASGSPYGLVWPPHVLFVLAAVVLSGRQGLRRLGDGVGVLCWCVAAALALGFMGWLVWRSVAGHGMPVALLVTCLVVALVAMVRTARILRGLRAAQAPRR